MNVECSCAELALRRRRSRGLLEDVLFLGTEKDFSLRLMYLKLLGYIHFLSWNYAFSVFNIILNKHIFISYCGIVFFLFLYFYLSDEQSYFPL